MTKKLDPKPVDRRSLRTRGALGGAMMALLAERNWDDIAVQDLCDRANIGRSTFYLHYPNKDALLQGGLEGLEAELQRQARAQARPAAAQSGSEVTRGFGFTLGLIEHAHDQRKVFRSLIGRRSGQMVQQRFREMVIRLITHELPPDCGNFPPQAIARSLAGALVELLSWWVEQRSPLPSADLRELFDELSRPVLSQRHLRG